MTATHQPKRSVRWPSTRKKMRTIVKLLSACALLITFVATQSVAQSSSHLEALVFECEQIRQESAEAFAARSLAQPIASAIEALAQTLNSQDRLDTVSNDVWRLAGECVAFARQVKSGMEFSSTSDGFVSSVAHQKLQAQEEAIRAIEGAKTRQQQLYLEINARVFEACSQLAASDPTNAYTNHLCVESFKANGLPDQ